jgi:hypothetical protein
VYQSVQGIAAYAALIIPRPSPDGAWNPWQRFLDNGRWSLVALSCYSLIAFFSNSLYFEIQLFSSENIPNLILSVLFFGVFFIKNRMYWIGATVVAAAYSGYEIIKLSPATYS